jgi:hypothetical protein
VSVRAFLTCCGEPSDALAESIRRAEILRAARDPAFVPPNFGVDIMRSRDRILTNLESIYRESYDRAKEAGDRGRMIELDSAYMRDQLMLEILLDIRDLFSVAPAASGGSALEQLEAIRRLTKLR